MLWDKVASFIFRFRISLLVAVGLLTVVSAYYASKAELEQEFVKVVPESDKDYQDFLFFKRLFKEDADAVLFAFEGENLFQPQAIAHLRQILDSLKQLQGIKNVLSYANVSQIVLDTIEQRFKWQKIEPKRYPKVLDSLPVFQNLLFSTEKKIGFTIVRFKSHVLNTKEKFLWIPSVIQRMEQYAQQHQLSIHYTGIPYLRVFISTRLPKELYLFTFFALVLTALALYGFYRSWYAVIFPLVLLIVCSIATMGIIGFLGYKITLLTGLLPPIIVILGIPPSIYMLADYHDEFTAYPNKLVALRRMLRKLGWVTFMINANTAFSFLTLYFTEVVPLQEFGIVAFLSTMLAYVLTIIIIPGVFSLLPPPSKRQLKHLESPWIARLLQHIADVVQYKRKTVYWTTTILFLIGVWGLFYLEARSYVFDDLPKTHRIVNDLHFIENHIGGAVPFEILFDTGKKNGIRKYKNIKKIAQLQDSLQQFAELSRPISYVEGLKWLRQAFYQNQPDQYDLPTREELAFIRSYIKKLPIAQENSLIDTTGRYVRISAFMKDIGSHQVPILYERLQKIVKQIFGDEEKLAKRNQKVYLTGTTKIFLKANEYLLDNLAWSLLAAFVIIGLQMFILFNSWRIMWISMIPNLIPLVLTAGIMGFLDIPLKPSTVLIYEMAFGIAIDNSIHYLAMYRYRRVRMKENIEQAVRSSLRITGLGILYTSGVLFLGFIAFAPSAFGSTRALGILTAITLFIALFSNLYFMPALLLSWDKHKAMPKKALIDDEMEDMP